jgi:hypothetical protein
MNERIDELMIEAGARFEFLHGVHYDDFQYKKFAELLIQECARIVPNTDLEDVDGGDSAVLRAASDQIKEHFGVE